MPPPVPRADPPSRTQAPDRYPPLGVLVGKFASDDHSVTDSSRTSTPRADSRHHALLGRPHTRRSIHHWTRDRLLRLLDENLEGAGTSRVCSPRLGVPPRGRSARGGAAEGGSALRGAELVASPVHNASDAELSPGSAACSRLTSLLLSQNPPSRQCAVRGRRRPRHRRQLWRLCGRARSTPANQVRVFLVENHASRSSHGQTPAGFTSSAPSRARKRI